jgi:hypothetical protein
MLSQPTHRRFEGGKFSSNLSGWRSAVFAEVYTVWGFYRESVRSRRAVLGMTQPFLEQRLRWRTKQTRGVFKVPGFGCT